MSLGYDCGWIGRPRRGGRGLCLVLGCWAAGAVLGSEMDGWERAKSQNNCKGYLAFLEQHPDGKMTPPANKRVDELGCRVAVVPPLPPGPVVPTVSRPGGTGSVAPPRPRPIPPNPSDPSSQAAVDFVSAYYDALNSADVGRAASMRERVPDSLASTVSDNEYCRISIPIVAAIDSSGARLHVDVRCKNRRGRPEDWPVVVLLIRQGDSWKIRSIDRRRQ